ncbi:MULTISPECIES: hypothetical protein [Streptomyces]|uniref:hypothetical protein n=1 Tax=Streptomyces TaxID=1883 RepID=UPI0021D1D7D8|nr:hypothetical protein [Streptomyces sp. G-5]MCU4748877.1 hypothetical protein [Streptomyces sp. G-5]
MTERRGPNDQLRALLREAGWTQADLARAVNALGAEAGTALRYDRTAVAHWLSGTQPRHPVPQLIAEALSRRTGRPLTVREAGFPGGPTPPAAGPQAARRTGPVPRFAQLCRTDADGGRRASLLRQRPYRVADAAVPLPVPGPRPPVPEGPPAEATRALHEATVFFATAMRTHGGRHARGALALHLAEDVAPLLVVPGRPPATRAELLTGAARLAFVLARMYEDGQRHGLAQRYFTSAHQLAGEAGDRATWSVVLRAMSGQAQRLGQLPSALRLAEAAARTARWAPPAQQSYIQAQLGVVLAHCGDRRGALRALVRAEHAGQRAEEQGPGTGGPFDRYPRWCLLYQTALTLEALGDLPGAMAALRRGAAERPAADVRGHALTQAKSGRLLLRAGHLEEACAAWEAFVTGRERLRSGDVELALRAMRQVLRPYRGRPRVARLLARSGRPAGEGGF